MNDVYNNNQISITDSKQTLAENRKRALRKCVMKQKKSTLKMSDIDSIYKMTTDP